MLHFSNDAECTHYIVVIVGRLTTMNFICIMQVKKYRYVNKFTYYIVYLIMDNSENDIYSLLKQIINIYKNNFFDSDLLITF